MVGKVLVSSFPNFKAFVFIIYIYIYIYIERETHIHIYYMNNMYKLSLLRNL